MESTKEINETSNKSRYAVVSATLFDKKDHAVQFLELTGIKACILCTDIIMVIWTMSNMGLVR